MFWVRCSLNLTKVTLARLFAAWLSAVLAATDSLSHISTFLRVPYPSLDKSSLGSITTDTMVLERLRLLLSHITGTSPPNSPYPGLSYHVGPTSKPLKHITLHQLLAEQVILNGDCEALVSAWQGIRWTYRELDRLSDELARRFYGLGIRKGDRMGIMAGNCGEYVLVLRHSFVCKCLCWW